MTSSLIEVESLLAIDIGSVNTRALLFDVTDGRFRFVAAGQSPSTHGAPHKDIGVGIGQALERLREVTGRVLTDRDGQIIIPSQPDGSGVDAIVSTSSAGSGLNVVVAGILDDVSIESARKLASGTYSRVVECLGLNDHRKMEAQMDAVIAARPDLVIIAGGTDGGASRPITRLTEVLALACYLIPANHRPQVLYAGNPALAEEIQAQFKGITPFCAASNIRPSLDLEDLDPAADALADLAHSVRSTQLGGLSQLNSLSNGHALSTARAFGRIIRFLSQVYDPAKGVLGLDLGASSTTLAAAFAGRLSLRVSHPLGVGAGITALLDPDNLAGIARWLPNEISEQALLDTLRQKIAFPASLPAAPEEMEIEQAAARQAIRLALRGLGPRPDGTPTVLQGGLALPFEPVIASGAVIARAPTPGQSLMMLLDGLQPVGITTLVLDQNSLVAALGAAARLSSLLPVQVLESGAFLHLATVIAPISRAPSGAPILNARLAYPDGSEEQLEVCQGSLHATPLKRSQSADLYLEPIGETDLGMLRPGRGVKISGGVLGAIIDARGRPVLLPNDPAQRGELLKKWLWTVGG